jgi:hypothetical protein
MKKTVSPKMDRVQAALNRLGPGRGTQLQHVMRTVDPKTAAWMFETPSTLKQLLAVSFNSNGAPVSLFDRPLQVTRQVCVAISDEERAGRSRCALT